MQQEPSDKLKGIQGNLLYLIAIPVIPITKRYLTIIQPDHAFIGDGNPMRVSSQVLKDLFRTTKRPLAIGNPFLVVKGIQKGLKLLPFP